MCYFWQISKEKTQKKQFTTSLNVLNRYPKCPIGKTLIYLFSRFINLSFWIESRTNEKHELQPFSIFCSAFRGLRLMSMVGKCHISHQFSSFSSWSGKRNCQNTRNKKQVQSISLTYHRIHSVGWILPCQLRVQLQVKFQVLLYQTLLFVLQNSKIIRILLIAI